MILITINGSHYDDFAAGLAMLQRTVGAITIVATFPRFETDAFADENSNATAGLFVAKNSTTSSSCESVGDIERKDISYVVSPTTGGGDHAPLNMVCSAEPLHGELVLSAAMARKLE